MSRTRNPELTVALDHKSTLPLYLQIAHAVVGDIRRGRLRSGDALPGSRTLAQSLGVHRNTVLAAYTELAVEGWVTPERAGGTFVADDLPIRGRAASDARSGVLARLPGYPVGAPLPNDRPPAYRPDRLLLARAIPDVRLLPTAEIVRGYRRVLTRAGTELLTYGDSRGHVRLRTAIAAMLGAARGIAAPPDAVMITRGSQMALDLTARALVEPGDAVAVEALGQRATWNAFRQAGAELLPIPVDADGLCVDVLERLVARQRVRAVYMTPHTQFPTTVALSDARRDALLALASRHRIAIVEDDYDHEFRYEGRPVFPLASSDPAGVVIYVGTLSKILAPGLRVGFVAAPLAVIERLASLRYASDLQGDLAVECMVAELFETGELGRHVRRMRRAYHARRDALVDALRHELGDALEFTVPARGMALWARVAPDIDIDEWSERAAALGVVFRGGRPYDFADAVVPYTRLGFSFHDERELTDAARRMALALRQLRRSRQGRGGTIPRADPAGRRLLFR